MAAAEEPSPLPCGITFSARSRSPPALNPAVPSVSRTVRIIRWVSSVGSEEDPSPATWARKTPSSVVSSVTVSYRPRARPRLSNPGPRLALVAGTCTLTHCPALTTARSKILKASLLQAQGCRHADDVEVDLHRGDLGPVRGAQRPLRILQPVAGDGDDDGLALGHLAGCVLLDQSGNARGRARLDEDTLLGGQPAVRSEDFAVGHRINQAAGLLPGGDGAVPGSRVADPDRGGDGLGLGDRVPEHQRCRPRGLEAPHLRGLGG